MDTQDNNVIVMEEKKKSKIRYALLHLLHLLHLGLHFYKLRM